MNTVIIGNADSIWVKKIVEETIVDKEHLWIISRANKLFSDYYKTQGVKIICIGEKRRYMSDYLKIKGAIKNIQLDLAIVHYMSYDNVILLAMLKSIDHKVKSIGCYWGSDIYRARNHSIMINKAFLPRLDVINITTDDMMDKFHELYGSKYDSKMTRLLFGVNGISYIKNYIDKKRECKRELSIPENNITIAIGYNASTGQNHLKVLNELSALASVTKEKLTLILRMTYGQQNGSNYLSEVERKAKESNIQYILFSNFLSDEDSALLTCATDIFIHAQNTDALSASVIEHLQAKAILINPEWIHYRELDEKGIYYIKYKRIQELNQIIQNIIEEETMNKKNRELTNNSKIVYMNFSWDKRAPLWQNIYKRTSAIS